MSDPSPLSAAQLDARMRRDAGDLAGATATLADALERVRPVYGEDHPEVLGAALALSRFHREAGHPAYARTVLEEALAAGQRRFGDGDPLLLAISFDLGTVAEELGNRHEARRNFGRVAAAGPAALGEDHWAVRAARAYLGEEPATEVLRDVSSQPAPLRFGPKSASHQPQQPVPGQPVPQPASGRAAPEQPASRKAAQPQTAAAHPPPPAPPPARPTAPQPSAARPVASQPSQPSQPVAPQPAPAWPVAQQQPPPAPPAAAPTAPSTTAPWPAGPSPAAPSPAPPIPVAPSYPAAIGGQAGQPTVGARPAWASSAYPGRLPAVQRPPTPGGFGPPVPANSQRRGRGTAIAAGVTAVAAVTAAVLAGVAVFRDRDDGGTLTADGQTTAPVSISGEPPVDVRVSREGEALVVTWTDPAPGRVSFVVTGGKQGEELRFVGQVPSGAAPRLPVHGLNPALAYCFQVAAVYSTTELGVAQPVCTGDSSFAPSD